MRNGRRKIDADCARGGLRILLGSPEDHGTRSNWTLEILRTVIRTRGVVLSRWDRCDDAARAGLCAGEPRPVVGLSVEVPSAERRIAETQALAASGDDRRTWGGGWSTSTRVDIHEPAVGRMEMPGHAATGAHARKNEKRLHGGRLTNVNDRLVYVEAIARQLASSSTCWGRC